MTTTTWTETAIDDLFSNIPGNGLDESPYLPTTADVEPVEDVTADFTPAQVAQAHDAITDDAVIRVEHLYLVVSSDGSMRYEVAIEGDGACTCTAAHYGRRCWHLLAARLADRLGWPDTDPDEIGFAPLDGDRDGDSYSTDPLDL